MAEIVERAWTPIGSEGFEYYWDPDEFDGSNGMPSIYWRHTETEYPARVFVNPKDLTAAEGTDFEYDLGYLLERRTWDLERQYRDWKMMQAEGIDWS